MGATPPRFNVAAFEEALDWIQKIRNVRAEMQIPPGTEIEILVKTDKIVETTETIQTLTKSRIILVDVLHQDAFGTSLPMAQATLFIPLPKELLFKECNRLEKQIEAVHKKIDGLKGRLENQEFVAKAPPELLKTTQEQHQLLLDELFALKGQHERLLQANRSNE